MYSVDPEDFFKQSFGGDRFVDIIGEMSLGRDMREALETAEDDDMTPEEKAEKEAQSEQERNTARTKRIDFLAEKLEHKLSLFDTLGEQEFVNQIKLEAEDLKLENHGVDLLHSIGYTYQTKVTQYNSKKSIFGLYYSIREKGYIFSQTVGTLKTAYDLQSTFGELQKAEEKGLSDEEKAKLEEAAATKVKS